MSAFVDILRPSRESFLKVFNVAAVVGGSLLLALFSQLSIPLGFTPVPLTLQSFAVLLMGGLLGSKRGAAAVILYLVEGAVGLPFFAGGRSGFAALVGPTGGYLVGFVIAAFLIGYLLEHTTHLSFKRALAAIALGGSVILVVGTLWLASFIGVNNAFHLGVLPFFVGDALKVIAAASFVASGSKLLRT